LTTLNFPSIKRAGRHPADTDIQSNFLSSPGLRGAIAHLAISRRASHKSRGNQSVFCELDPPKAAASLWQKGNQKLAEGKPKTGRRETKKSKPSSILTKYSKLCIQWLLLT
jgi:hypothetical protein